jgi:hypothetical protein
MPSEDAAVTLPRFLLVLVLVLAAACGGGRQPEPAADASDSALVVDRFVPIPDILRVGCELPSGQLVPMAEITRLDDCVECTCTTFGARCRRAASCARDICVFVDGAVVENGGSTAIGCFDCTCNAGIGACVRRTDSLCPETGCLLPDGETVIADGESRFISECHSCQCDAITGLRCEDTCHPVCHCLAPGEPDAESCTALATAVGAAVELPSQAFARIGELECLCDYGVVACR